jgi:hypothetical protein
MGNKGIGELHRSVVFAAAILAAYFAAAYALKTEYDPLVVVPNVVGHKFLLQRPFVHFASSNFAVVTNDHWFAKNADSASDTQRSKIVIYENDVPLGPGHSLPHEAIGTEGQGRFSHWRNDSASVFVFSSTDNSDPESNGRNYWLVSPEPGDARNNSVRDIIKPFPEEEPLSFIPSGKIVIPLQRPFETFEGSHMAVAHSDDPLAELADDADNQDRSPIVLYEDDHPLGPAHSSHTDIARLGGGRYSHWKTQGMVFSSSDNSDPNANGRRYWSVLPEQAKR